MKKHHYIRNYRIICIIAFILFTMKLLNHGIYVFHKPESGLPMLQFDYRPFRTYDYLMVDQAGNIYIEDSSHSITKIEDNGSIVFCPLDFFRLPRFSVTENELQIQDTHLDVYIYTQLGMYIQKSNATQFLPMRVHKEVKVNGVQYSIQNNSLCSKVVATYLSGNIPVHKIICWAFSMRMFNIIFILIIILWIAFGIPATELQQRKRKARKQQAKND